MNAYEYLIKKGVKKVHQPKKQYSLSVSELVEFLEEFAREKKATLMRSMPNTGHKKM